jgi:multidrug efflux pump subunit AcrA (membrane-fusion protein)
VVLWLVGLGSLSLLLSVSAYFMMGGSREKVINVLTHRVARGQFLLDVVEEGEIESSSNVEIRCEVKTLNSSGIMLMEVVDEGTYVEAGDVLVKFDSSALEQDRIQQQILCNTAEAKMVQSKNTWEAAEIAYKEYVEGTFFQEEQTIQSEIFIAEENLRRAQEYVKYSQRLAARGYVTAQQLEGDQFAVEKAKTELATGKTKLRVLQEYTKPKMMKELESAIRTAEATFAADKSSYELELTNLKEIESQIDKCVMKAPQAGQVVHANQEGRRGDNEFVVEPGALVREGQVIIRLPDPSQMQVKAKISESRVNLVKVGMTVTIRLDALDNMMLDGEVVKVNEYPEPSSWFSSSVKEYATWITIISPPKAIRPGLTAEVTIHAEKHDDALILPIQAVHDHGGTLYSFVRDGMKWRAQPVEVIGSNDSFVRLAAGLQPGDEVAMAPRTLLEVVDLPKLEDAEEGDGAGKGEPGSGSTNGTEKAKADEQPAQTSVEQESDSKASRETVDAT